jgi:hypothetical protein
MVQCAASIFAAGDVATITTSPRGREKALLVGQRVLVVVGNADDSSGFWNLVSVVKIPASGRVPEFAETGHCWAVRAEHLAKVAS